MKGFFKKLTAVFCTAAVALSMGGCGLFDEDSSQVINAYDIAVQNGFTGTEQEWLNSLRGKDGVDGEDLDIYDVYEAVQKDGYEGSFSQFIKDYFSVDVQEDNAVQTIAKNVSSVVSVYAGFSVTKKTGYGYYQQNTTEYTTSAGSGVVITLNKEAGNALIITNYHVLYNKDADNKISTNVCVYPYGALNRFSAETGDENGGGITATYVGGAMDYDIAVLKIEGSEKIRESNLTAAEFGNSDSLIAGEKVFAIGNANAQGIAVTNGVVSKDSEYITISALDGRDENRDNKVDGVEYRVLRTDAAINGGNSGGGLFNARGELIGIVNAKNVQEATDNMGYALPITQVAYLLNNLNENGAVKKAMLGIETTITDSASVWANGALSIVEEFTVTKVLTGYAAEQKLLVGDVIESITLGNETVTLTRQFQLGDYLFNVRKGDTVKLGILREGERITVEIPFDKDEYFVLHN